MSKRNLKLNLVWSGERKFMVFEKEGDIVQGVYLGAIELGDAEYLVFTAEEGILLVGLTVELRKAALFMKEGRKYLIEYTGNMTVGRKRKIKLFDVYEVE